MSLKHCLPRAQPPKEMAVSPSWIRLWPIRPAYSNSSTSTKLFLKLAWGYSNKIDFVAPKVHFLVNVLQPPEKMTASELYILSAWPRRAPSPDSSPLKFYSSCHRPDLMLKEKKSE